MGFEEAGRSAAEVDGVYISGHLNLPESWGQERGVGAGGGDLGAEAFDVAIHARGGEGVGGEVAEGALGLAEWDGEIEAEGGVHALAVS